MVGAVVLSIYAATSYAAQQQVNIGTVANDGTGHTPRIVGQIINSNFAELYAGGGLIDVTKHGMIGDGVTDNYSAFTNIVQTLGRNLLFPGGDTNFPTANGHIGRYLIDISSSADNIGMSFVNDTDGQRWHGLSLKGDGIYNTIIQFTNAGAGLYIDGNDPNNAGPDDDEPFYGLHIDGIGFWGDGVSIQSNVIEFAIFNANIGSMDIFNFATETNTAALYLTDCWNLHADRLSVEGGSVTYNGVHINNANQMSIDHFFSHGFAATTNAPETSALYAASPEGFEIGLATLQSLSPVGIMLEATGTNYQGSIGPTRMNIHSEGPARGFIGRNQVGSANYLNNIELNYMGFHRGGGHILDGDNYPRSAITLTNVQNLVLHPGSFAATRNRGSLINYCVLVDSSCRDIDYSRGVWQHTATEFQLLDLQPAPFFGQGQFIQQMLNSHPAYTQITSVSNNTSQFTNTVNLDFRGGADQRDKVQTPPQYVRLKVATQINAVGSSGRVVTVLSSPELNAGGVTHAMFTAAAPNGLSDYRVWTRTIPFNSAYAGMVEHEIVTVPVSNNPTNNSLGEWTVQHFIDGGVGWDVSFSTIQVGMIY